MNNLLYFIQKWSGIFSLWNDKKMLIFYFSWMVHWNYLKWAKDITNAKRNKRKHSKCKWGFSLCDVEYVSLKMQMGLSLCDVE